MTQRALRQSIGTWPPVLPQQRFFQRTGVDANADHGPVGLGRIHHLVHMPAGADIAGVDAQPFQTCFQRRDGQTVVKMNIGYQRQIRTRADGAQSAGGGRIRHGQAHGLTTAGGQTLDLGQGGVHIAGIRIGHALHHDRRAAADNQPAQPDGAGFCVAHALLHREHLPAFAAGRKISQ